MTRPLLIAAAIATLATLGLGIAWAMGGTHAEMRPEWDDYRDQLREGL